MLCNKLHQNLVIQHNQFDCAYKFWVRISGSWAALILGLSCGCSQTLAGAAVIGRLGWPKDSFLHSCGWQAGASCWLRVQLLPTQASPTGLPQPGSWFPAEQHNAESKVEAARPLCSSLGSPIVTSVLFDWPHEPALTQCRRALHRQTWIIRASWSLATQEAELEPSSSARWSPLPASSVLGPSPHTPLLSPSPSANPS